MDNISTMQKLQTYIDAESSDAALYRELAVTAPKEEYRRLLLEFADDEQTHADRFKEIYRRMFGRSYSPVVKKPDLEGRTFDEIVRDRVLDESGDFRKYGQQYIQTQRSDLKNAYYLARTDENVHALRLLYMLS